VSRCASAILIVCDNKAADRALLYFDSRLEHKKQGCWSTVCERKEPFEKDESWAHMRWIVKRYSGVHEEMSASISWLRPCADDVSASS
jgi:hypothetical protein